MEKILSKLFSKPLSLFFYTKNSGVEVCSSQFLSEADMDIQADLYGINLFKFAFDKKRTQDIIAYLDLDDFEVRPSYLPPGCTVQCNFESGPISQISVTCPNLAELRETLIQNEISL